MKSFSQLSTWKVATSQIFHRERINNINIDNETKKPTYENQIRN